MSQVQTIDFSKYRTDELFEQVSEILNPGAIAWKIFCWVAFWLLVTCAAAVALFAWQVHWSWLLVSIPLSMLFGLLGGLLFGVARAIRSAIDRFSQLLSLIMQIVQHVVVDCRDLKTGKQQLPSRSELVYAVYAQVMLPTIEKVVCNRFGFLAKPFFWAYRLTLGRLVRVFIKQDVEQKTEEELALVANSVQAVADQVNVHHDQAHAVVATGREQNSMVAGVLKTGCSIPLYTLFAVAMVICFSILIGLRIALSS
jgi:hypothetical protein